ncbi:tetratricopeptide repeat protein [Candidatus Korobacter versatilis]|nr:tetratricopeptide repeat protein [Candidatus Koribacter versatilis]
MNPKALSSTLAVLLLSATASLALPNGPTLLAQQKQDAPTPTAPAKPNAAQPTSNPEADAKKPANRADAYYHYTMAHMYEEMVATYGRAEYANKAIEEYRAAITADPSSDYLNAGLADLYWRTGRIRDAVLEAQEILKRDPKNVDAHRLLGRIYLRSLGDMQSGNNQSRDMQRLAIEQYEEIVKLDPTSVEDHLLLGRLYSYSNDLTKAEKEFKTAVQIQPDSEEAVTMLAYLYTQEGDTKKAQEVLSNIPDDDRSAKLYSTLGYTYEEQKDYKKAIEAYRKAVMLDKENLDSVRGLAQNLLNDGQLDAALEQYKIIVDQDPSDAQSYQHIAEIDRRNGKFEAALDALKKASALVQDSQEIPYNMAVIYEGQGRYEDAINTIQQLLTKTDKPDASYSSADRSNRSIFLERLGNIYREANKPQQAVETFRRMIALGDDPASRAYQEMVETYRDNRDWPSATAAAQEGAKKLPKDRGLQLVLAAQLADEGKADQALSIAKSQLNGKAADDREVYVSLAQMYTRLKKYPEAEDAIAQAMKLAGTQDERNYVTFVQGSIYEREKKFEQAEEAFRKVINADPKNAGALNYLGYMLADRGTRLEEALGMLRKAVQMEPQNGAYLDSLGWAYFKMGNYEQAEENLRKASDKIGSDPTVQDHLGDLYQKTGRLKLAATQWERALDQWNHSVPAEVDADDVAKVQKKLESAKIKLAQQTSTTSNTKQ